MLSAVYGRTVPRFAEQAPLRPPDADQDGCNTRAEALKDEAVSAPTQGPNCRLSAERGFSPYNDRYIQGSGSLGIDHLVPLAEDWDSGASAWSTKEREAYANDLGDNRALIAVSGASNRSKADQDPSTCQYVSDWVADKHRWGLTPTPVSTPRSLRRSTTALTFPSPLRRPANPPFRSVRGE
ncbi:HNH endonuclease family protein [Streptomyces sp. NPDC006314]|uniref:HNH endonuclease family protein n=1 Tax=Streptomyces sp. NPDC006314 TaxID=3154475 RepID=UPI0033A6E840